MANAFSPLIRMGIVPLIADPLGLAMTTRLSRPYWMSRYAPCIPEGNPLGVSYGEGPSFVRNNFGIQGGLNNGLHIYLNLSVFGVPRALWIDGKVCVVKPEGPRRISCRIAVLNIQVPQSFITEIDAEVSSPVRVRTVGLSTKNPANAHKTLVLWVVRVVQDSTFSIVVHLMSGTVTGTSVTGFSNFRP